MFGRTFGFVAWVDEAISSMVIASLAKQVSLSDTLYEGLVGRPSSAEAIAAFLRKG